MEIGTFNFVRTKDGYIAKCIEIDKENEIYIFNKTIQEVYGYKLHYLNFNDTNKVKKQGYNILDVIEAGNYVDGRKVLNSGCGLEYTDDDSEYGVNEVDNGLELEGYEYKWIYFDNQIKEVITHELYEANCYKLGDE